jgi:hypothetical protein
MRDELEAQVIEFQKQYQESEALLIAKQADLDEVTADVNDKTDEFVNLSENFDKLQNELAITHARQKGLSAEVARLNTLVGHLDDANRRRAATKDALAHAINRLYVQIKEGMPLTPEKYAHRDRLAAVEDLRDSVANARWVSPALEEAYANLVETELEIAAKEIFFFAKLPVLNKLDLPSPKWAECLMKGNHAVYYRTLDGSNTGVFKDVSETGEPEWIFKEDLPSDALKDIEAALVGARTGGFDEKKGYLLAKEKEALSETKIQRAFGSL